MWSGAIVDIPTGWSLCDGSNGTPNLQDKFVVGGGNDYAYNSTGGTKEHNHSVSMTTSATLQEVQSGTGTFVNASNHIHSVSSAQEEVLPPYYALAFIMYTG